MSIVLFDTEDRKSLYPLTTARSVADIRIGILTRKEWWEVVSNQKVYVSTEKHLQPLYAKIPEGKHLYIRSTILPEAHLLKKLLLLSENRALLDENGQLIAANGSDTFFQEILSGKSQNKQTSKINSVKKLEFPWQIFQWNEVYLRADFELLTKNRKSAKISKTNQVIAPENIFIEKDAVVECSILNASTGPIYIGKQVTIMEGACIRGAFAILKNSVVKMGAKIYGATTIGPNCVVGGEIKNSVLMANSNKAHDGYLGDSVIGQWVNLGGGTTNSNIKNTVGPIKMWNIDTDKETEIGKKGGCIVGDYSRTAINSSINTGSIFGIASNIFGNGLLPTKIPNGIWGTDNKSPYLVKNAIRDIEKWMELKNHTIKNTEKEIIEFILEKKA
ncbi:putative sugar nucleotidyl transferase [Rhizosphaericola mali]|nr:putative sugar nucleotidyl transferase [Rhizosphaericola mali]